MAYDDEYSILASRLADRVRSVLKDQTIGTGTLLSSCMITALRLDRRMSGHPNGLQVQADLTYDEIANLAASFTDTITGYGCRSRLPLGTECTGGRPGDLRIGGESWLLNAGEPDLHPMELMRVDAHGPNLELLQRHIRRLTRNLACRRIGVPSAAQTANYEVRHLLRSQPVDAAGGVVLEHLVEDCRALVFAAALPHQIEAFARLIVAKMQELWKRREEIAARVQEVRKVSEKAAKRAGATVGAIGVDLKGQTPGSPINLIVHYEAIDAAMRQGPTFDVIPGNSDLSKYSFLKHFAARVEERRKLRRKGANGWIDDMAKAVLEGLPYEAGRILWKLKKGYDIRIVIPTTETPMYARFCWRAGCIEVDITMPGRAHWSASVGLIMKGVSLPYSIIYNIVGRTVDEFVELPFLCPIQIRSVDINEGTLKVDLYNFENYIELATGRIWAPNRGIDDVY